MNAANRRVPGIGLPPRSAVFIGGFMLLCMFAGAPAFAGAPKEEPAPEAETDPDLEFAGRLERAFQKLAKRVAPCVVSLQVHIRPSNWQDELRRMTEQFGAPSLERQFEGSGVIIEPDGLIVTNEHVVRGADQIKVKLSDDRVFDAVIAGTDPRSDLAMIRLIGDNVPQNLPTAKLADSDKVEVGQWALAIGNPFGLSNTFTMGVVSARGRSMPVKTFYSDVFYGNLIQTDAAINPGNSGGPLFDLRGHLIGINTMIFSKSGISQGFGFAIPSNHLKPRLAYLKAGREIEYGWLGVKLRDLPDVKAFKVPDNKGVLIEDVIRNTPADRAGLQRGMVILSFDVSRIGSSQELMAAVNATPVGRTVKIKVLDRTGQPVDYDVRISKRYSELLLASQTIEDESDPLDIDGDELADTLVSNANEKRPLIWRGMQLKELTAEDGRKKGGRIEIVRIRKGSPADRAGLYEGAIVTELKHAGDPAVHKLESFEDLKRVLPKVTGAAAVHAALDGYVNIPEK